MKRLIMLLFAGFSILQFSNLRAQIDVIGQYKNRAEWSNGNKKPLLKSEKPGFYIAQRTRLGGIFNHEKFQLRVVAQDVRVWGSTSHLAVDNSGAFSIFEANATLFLSDKWSVKVGRQPISYDNQRIFGALDWAMQGRRHDAALVKFRDDSWSVDVGASYNQQKASTQHIFYELNDYKTFQYLWAHKEWEKLSASILFLNNGIEQHYMKDSIQNSRTNFSQTAGTQINYTHKKISLEGFGYYQLGKTAQNERLSAYNASINAKYTFHEKWNITLGGEVLSGTSQNANSSNINRSFGAYYGTSHKFNGFMDYFNRTANNNHTGLIDGYFKTGYIIKKFKIGLDHHFFYTAAPIQSNTIPQVPDFVAANPFLGYEMDLTVKYNFTKGVVIQAGYSQLFGTSTMNRIKGGETNSINNWAYVSLYVQPFKAFNIKNKEKASNDD